MANPSIAPPVSKKQTILVVDDESAIVRLCTVILDQAGFSVLPATNSSEALSICKNHSGPIHLLLTDLVMPPPMFVIASSDNEFPFVHGHDLAVRALRLRPELRVVLMSGNIAQELAGYGIRRTGLPFLAKPFEEQRLVTLVRRTLDAEAPSVEALTAAPAGLSKFEDEWGHG